MCTCIGKYHMYYTYMRMYCDILCGHTLILTYICMYVDQHVNANRLYVHALYVYAHTYVLCSFNCYIFTPVLNGCHSLYKLTIQCVQTFGRCEQLSFLCYQFQYLQNKYTCTYIRTYVRMDTRMYAYVYMYVNRECNLKVNL